MKSRALPCAQEAANALGRIRTGRMNTGAGTVHSTCTPELASTALQVPGDPYDFPVARGLSGVAFALLVVAVALSLANGRTQTIATRIQASVTEQYNATGAACTT